MKNLEIIPQLEAHESYKTLGVYLTADGNHKDELKELKDIAKAWADKISLSLLSANETVTAIHATIEKKLTYPLMALMLTQEECDEILQPLFRTMLPKMRINRNFSLKVLRAPGGLLGLQMPCLYTTQVTEHIDCLLRHGGTRSITGQLLNATL